MSQQPKYKFYPSILDKFTRFLDMTAEDYFYQDEDGSWHRNYNESTGEYRYSPSEVYDLSKKDLIDAINRVPTTSEDASKGTAFNELVDSFIHKKRSDRVIMRGNKQNDTIEVICDGSTFLFSYSFIEEVARYFSNSISQVYTSAEIETSYGTVELYGYIDELRMNRVYDIKTTKSYQFGQYKKYWQQHLYPYCLVESGMCSSVDSFEFTCYQLSGGTSKTPVITGRMYPELYVYQHEYSKKLLVEHCERFIEFLEENRDSITDKKIFGSENL